MPTNLAHAGARRPMALIELFERWIVAEAAVMEEAGALPFAAPGRAGKRTACPQRGRATTKPGLNPVSLPGRVAHMRRQVRSRIIHPGVLTSR